MNISGGQFKGRKISAPDEKITRPTLSKIRMGVFNTLYSMFGEFEGLSFLDVYGGSGIMGIEAASRGFSKITVIEQNKKSASIIKKNYETLGIKPELIIGNSLNVLQRLDNTYTVAYVDPPYSAGIYEETVSRLKDMSELIILEHPADMECPFDEIVKQKKYGDKLLTYIKQS